MLMLSKMAPIFRRRNCGRAKEITTISNMKILFIARLFWKCHHISIVLILLGYTQTIHEFWILYPNTKYTAHISFYEAIYRITFTSTHYIHNNIHTIKLQSYWRWHIPHLQNPSYQNSRIWHIPVDIFKINPVDIKDRAEEDGVHLPKSVQGMVEDQWRLLAQYQIMMRDTPIEHAHWSRF